MTRSEREGGGGVRGVRNVALRFNAFDEAEGYRLPLCQSGVTDKRQEWCWWQHEACGGFTIICHQFRVTRRATSSGTCIGCLQYPGVPCMCVGLWGVLAGLLFRPGCQIATSLCCESWHCAWTDAMICNPSTHELCLL